MRTKLAMTVALLLLPIGSIFFFCTQARADLILIYSGPPFGTFLDPTLDPNYFTNAPLRQFSIPPLSQALLLPIIPSSQSTTAPPMSHGCRISSSFKSNILRTTISYPHWSAERSLFLMAVSVS